MFVGLFVYIDTSMHSPSSPTFSRRRPGTAGEECQGYHSAFANTWNKSRCKVSIATHTSTIIQDKECKHDTSVSPRGMAGREETAPVPAETSNFPAKARRHPSVPAAYCTSLTLSVSLQFRKKAISVLSSPCGQKQIHINDNNNRLSNKTDRSTNE